MARDESVLWMPRVESVLCWMATGEFVLHVCVRKFALRDRICVRVCVCVCVSILRVSDRCVPFL